MANHFKIPAEIERTLRSRDRVCVYCRCKMKEHLKAIGSPKDKATLEHFNRNGPFYWGDRGMKAEDLAYCCQSCNSSRRQHKLSVWFTKDYCKSRGITAETVARPVKDYLKRSPRK